MKTLFPLALLCLILSSCASDFIGEETNNVTESRTNSLVSICLKLPDETISCVEAFKVHILPKTSTTFESHVYTNVNSFYAVECILVSLNAINGDVKCTNTNGQIFNVSNCQFFAVSNSQVKLVVGSNHINTSSSFIGEDSDGM